MLPLYTIQKFLRFPFYKISIPLLLFFVCLGKSYPIQIQKYKKSVIMECRITDFILIYSLILLFCFVFGIPIASLNLFIFFLNQLTCEIPSMLRLNLSSVFCLREQSLRHYVPPPLYFALQNTEEEGESNPPLIAVRYPAYGARQGRIVIQRIFFPSQRKSLLH